MAEKKPEPLVTIRLKTRLASGQTFKIRIPGEEFEVPASQAEAYIKNRVAEIVVKATNASPKGPRQTTTRKARRTTTAAHAAKLTR